MIVFFRQELCSIVFSTPRSRVSLLYFWNSISTSFLKDILFLVGSFSFSVLKMFLHYFLVCNVSKMFASILIFVLLHIICFFPSGCFSHFLIISFLQQFDHEVPWWSFLYAFLLGACWASLTYEFIVFIKFSAIVFSNIFSGLSFTSPPFWDSRYMYVRLKVVSAN